MFIQTCCFGQFNYYLKGGGNMSSVFRESIYNPGDSVSITGSANSYGLESKSAFGGYLTFEALKRTKDLEYGIGVQLELIRENYFVVDGKIFFNSVSELNNFIISNYFISISPNIKYNFKKFGVAFSLEIPFYNYYSYKEISKEGSIIIKRNSETIDKNSIIPTLKFFVPISKMTSIIPSFSLYKSNNILVGLGAQIKLNKNHKTKNHGKY